MYAAYEPKIDFARAENDVVGHCIEEDTGQSVLWAITDLVEDILDAVVGPEVPDFDRLAAAARDVSPSRR